MPEYAVFHQRRSGGHFLIKWMFENLKTPKVFCNSLPTGAKTLAHPVIEGEVRDPYTCRNKILSFEDPQRSRTLWGAVHKVWDNWPTIKPVVLLRDFYNTMASRLAQEDKRSSHFRKGDDLGWINFAKDWRNLETACMTLRYNDLVHPSFDFKQLGKRLQLDTHNPPNRDEVPSYGGGSSFDGQTIPGSQMDVLTRYSRFLEDEFYRSVVLRNDEARRLNAQIFGWYLTPEGAYKEC